MDIIRLPLLSQENEPHVPIMISKNMNPRVMPSRIMVVFGNDDQDLGIWSFRGIGRDGINAGSTVNFVKTMLASEINKDTFLVLANIGQLIWHCGTKRAVSKRTWEAEDRPHGPSPSMGLGPRNFIPGNKNLAQHVEEIFADVVLPNWNPHTKIDIICMGDGGMAVLQFLRENCESNSPETQVVIPILIQKLGFQQYHMMHKVNGVCFVDPIHHRDVDLDMSHWWDSLHFESFFWRRCCAYVLSDDDAGTAQKDVAHYGCNCYSSGESLSSDCMAIKAWPRMVAWLDKLYQDPSYSETRFIGSVSDEETTEVKTETDDSLDDYLKEQSKILEARDAEENSDEVTPTPTPRAGTPRLG